MFLSGTLVCAMVLSHSLDQNLHGSSASSMLENIINTYRNGSQRILYDVNVCNVLLGSKNGSLFLLIV